MRTHDFNNNGQCSTGDPSEYKFSHTENAGHTVGKYAAIIDLPHHVSVKHPPMSMANRAAQFSPFAALTGFDGVIDETAAERIDSIARSEQGEEFFEAP